MLFSKMGRGTEHREREADSPRRPWEWKIMSEPTGMKRITRECVAVAGVVLGVVVTAFTFWALALCRVFLCSGALGFSS